MTAACTVLLFSYGKLQYKDVQVATFGRELTGRPDLLPGYVRTITEAGGVPFYNIEPSATSEEAVSGTLFEITEQELAFADGYETSIKYRRISVTLRSGVQAWAYIQMVPQRPPQ
ncbi:MAG TPA: gamma-glutamylcyclotransferase family protein [Candidatus Angelobacter sp.]|nr:gamma-glutamylcyclotransferase family protein [Candidatus Angelobacter sp.]